jgi:hypothetical protein
MVLGEVLAARFVWVSSPGGTVPERYRVVGPKGGELHLGSWVTLLHPSGTTLDAHPDDCFATRLAAVKGALKRARGKVENHEKLLREARQDVTRLEGLLRSPEPTPADDPESILTAAGPDQEATVARGAVS